jgi:hypothetical protein
MTVVGSELTQVPYCIPKPVEQSVSMEGRMQYGGCRDVRELRQGWADLKQSTSPNGEKKKAAGEYGNAFGWDIRVVHSSTVLNLGQPPDGRSKRRSRIGVCCISRRRVRYRYSQGVLTGFQSLREVFSLTLSLSPGKAIAACRRPWRCVLCKMLIINNVKHSE